MPFSAFWSKLEVPSPKPLRIGFSDPTDPRIISAAQLLKQKKLAEPVLIQDISSVEKRAFRSLLAERQKKLNLTAADLDRQSEDPLYQGVCLLLEKKLDALVGGSLRPTADVVRAALQCVGPRAGTRLVGGHFLIETENLATADRTPFLFADCAVIPEPSPRALATVAQSAAEAYRFFTGQTPKVALLSFSTRGSAQHPLVDRIKEALEIVRKQDANLLVDSEIQVDAALDAQVAEIKKADDSPLSSKANVFVFPTLEAGNIGYKMVQRFSKARIAGPLLWGLDRPMSDLSRGCTVQEIIDTSLCAAAMARGQN